MLLFLNFSINIYLTVINNYYINNKLAISVSELSSLVLIR